MAATQQGWNGTQAVTKSNGPSEESHFGLHSRLLTEEQFAGQVKEAEHKSTVALGGNWDAEVGCREFAAWPATFSRTQFTRDGLHASIVAASGKNPTTAFLPLAEHGTLYATHDGYEYKHAAQTQSQDGTHVYWQVRRSGCLYQTTAMPEDLAHVDASPAISLEATVAYTAEAIDYAGRFYETLIGPDMNVTLRLRMTSTQGRGLVAPYGAEGGERACKLSEIVYEATLPVNDLRTRRASIVTDAVRDVLQQCSWRDPPTRDIRSFADAQITGMIYRHHRPQYFGR